MLYDEKLISAAGEEVERILRETRKRVDSGELPETIRPYVSKMRRKIWRAGGYVRFCRSSLKTIRADQKDLLEPRAVAAIIVQTYLDNLLSRISGERESDGAATSGQRWTNSFLRS
jgi:hypothetical protein